MYIVELPMAAASAAIAIMSSILPLRTSSAFFKSEPSPSPVTSKCAALRVRCSSEGTESSEGGDDDDFEARLAKLQRKVTSGTGKKAELRKARKEGLDPSFAATSSSTKSSKNVMLPPVPLREPVSDGLQVQLGFNSYTERLNGRFAALGLAAVLLVELATGGSFLKFHDSSTLSVQVYVMLAASALFIKLEKEKLSVWPKD